MVVSAGKIQRLAGHHAAPDFEELGGHHVALIVAEPEAVAFQLHRIAAGDHVDEQAAIGGTVQSGGHAGAHHRGDQAGAQRDEKSQVLGGRGDGGADDPTVFAGAAGGQQHAPKAELVGSLGDLAEIIEG